MTSSNPVTKSCHGTLLKTIKFGTFCGFIILRMKNYSNQEDLSQYGELNWEKMLIQISKFIHEVQLLGHWSWCSGLFGEIIREAWIWARQPVLKNRLRDRFSWSKSTQATGQRFWGPNFRQQNRFLTRRQDSKQDLGQVLKQNRAPC